MPKANPTVGEITGEYTASGSAAQTLQQLTVDDNQRHAGYDRDLFGFRQTDDDGNGCDVREDVLARDLTDVRYRQHGCKVESGTLAEGLRVGRVLATHERRVPVRVRGPADRRESQVWAERHHQGKAGDAVRAAWLPGAKRAGAVRRVAGGGA